MQPVKRSMKSKVTAPAFEAMSAAMMAPSPGVMVMMPMAPELSTPIRVHSSGLGWQIMCAKVTCLPGTYS